MLGFDAHEIGDDRAGWLARMHPEDRAAFDTALQRHIDARDGRPFDHELRLRHKDGSVRHVLSRGVAIRHVGGTAYRMVGLDTDITRVKRLQERAGCRAPKARRGRHGDAFLPALVRNFAACAAGRPGLHRAMPGRPTYAGAHACLLGPQAR